jgi:hypothetical protein
MQDIRNNPITAFINERITYFKNESFRLRDDRPLVEYKALVDTFFSIVQKLGTIEHEVALAALAEEYKCTTGEAAQAWKEIWRDFFWLRRNNIKVAHHFAHLESEVAARIRSAEEILKDTNVDNDVGQELFESIHEALASAKSVTGNRFSKKWTNQHWWLLLANLQIYTVYVQYFIARLWFIVLRHSFIIIVSVIICGMVYSKLARLLSGYVSGFVSKWQWAAGLLVIFGAAVLKKYYIDAKIKRIQVRFETRWLSTIAFNLHCVRTLALVSRAHAQTARQNASDSLSAKF